MNRLLKRLFESDSEQKLSFLTNAGADAFLTNALDEAFTWRPASEHNRCRMREAVATWYNAEVRESGFEIDMSGSHQVSIHACGRDKEINYDECEDTLIDILNAAYRNDVPALRSIWEEME